MNGCFPVKQMVGKSLWIPQLNYYSAEYVLFPLTFRAGVCISYPLSMAAYVTWSGFTVGTVYFSDHCLWAWPCYLHWSEGCCHTWLEHRSMHACLSFPRCAPAFSPGEDASSSYQSEEDEGHVKKVWNDPTTWAKPTLYWPNPSTCTNTWARHKCKYHMTLRLEGF